nr:MAG TPA: hypothetical protein [Caudoviricetes sp.]
MISFMAKVLRLINKYYIGFISFIQVILRISYVRRERKIHV